MPKLAQCLVCKAVYAGRTPDGKGRWIPYWRDIGGPAVMCPNCLPGEIARIAALQSPAERPAAPAPPATVTHPSEAEAQSPIRRPWRGAKAARTWVGLPYVPDPA
jgi:hypothetical protein